MEKYHKFIVLDVGTTTIKCSIMDSNTKILGSASVKVELLYPKEGWVEIDQDWLWNAVISTVNNALYDAQTTPADIKSIGIATQRSTFITWKKDTGEPFHRFIVWKDFRCRKFVDRLNNSLILKVIRFFSYLIYLFTRSTRYLAGSRLKIGTNHATTRLLWLLENIPILREEVKKNNVMFGTLETWLIYKLTKGNTFVTDVTNACCTGFFDPFAMEWGSWAINLLKIPSNILPQVVDNDYNFGETDVFGPSIKISASLGDQSAAMLGSCCFDKNDLKISVGTGAFVNLNTGDGIDCGEVSGMYPLVGWRLGGKCEYFTESPCYDCGSLIEWMKISGYIQDITDVNRLLSGDCKAEDLYFIPAFSGLGPPIKDENAGTGFIGINPTTTRDEMALAILESVILRIGLAFHAMRASSEGSPTKICIDGGVSKSDSICQMVSDITGLEVERAETEEVTSLGTLFACGLSEGIWDLKELGKLRRIQTTFRPNSNLKNYYKDRMLKWKKAAERFKGWYS